MAMEAWPLLGTSSSLPTNSSSSSSTTTTSSSSSSLPLTAHTPSVLDLVDELWFFRSVLPLPSLTFPCLPSPFSSSHSLDSSTLLAQLMSSTPTHYTPPTPSPRLSSSSSFSPSPPPQQQEEQLPLQNQSLHYTPWSFPSYQASLPPSDGEHEENTEEGEEEEEPADFLSDLDADLDAEDALSGIYDVGVLLKDQHLKSRQGGLSATLQETWLQATPRRELIEESQNTKTQVNSSKIEGLRELDVFEDDRHCKSSTISYTPSHAEAWLTSSTPFNFQVSALNEQVDMKEHLKLWAHAVASTLR